VLVPWTIRNYRVFHLFQPLAPAHAGDAGRIRAARLFQLVANLVDDSRLHRPVLWSLDTSSIKLDDIPDGAFDSAEEKQRVAALFGKI